MQNAIQEVIQEVSEDESSWSARTGSTDLSSDEESGQSCSDEEDRDQEYYDSRRKSRFVSQLSADGN